MSIDAVLDPQKYPLLEAYDGFFAALGFEARAIHAAKELGHLASSGLAVAFSSRQELAFEDNKAWFKTNGFVVENRVEAFLDHASSAQIEGKVSTYLVDVSSMSRPMMAQLVHGLAQAQIECRVDFLYSPAVFTKPSRKPPPQTFSGPVSGAFAGWSITPERPIAAILGVGYEFGRALGILEYLEPAVAWIFSPTGADDQYDAAVEGVNKHLFDLLPAGQRVRYNVGDPFRCFEQLEALVYALKDQARPVVIPFGPKLFALISMLVAEFHRPAVTVWRVSGEQSDQSSLHPALGPVFRLPVRFTSAGKA